MNTKLRLFCVTASLLLLMAASSTSQAIPTLGPMYPAPGGNGFNSTGASAGDAGGVNFKYSAFNTAAFTELYWGPWDNRAVEAGLRGALTPLHYSGQINAQTARWSGTTTWQDPNSGNVFNRPTELRVAISGLINPWTTTAGGTVSAAGVGAVVNNSLGSDFTANLQFWGVGNAGWQPLNDIQQLPGDRTVSSFSGGFFATPATVVPEPGTLILLGLGLSGMGFVKRRRR